MYKSFFKRFFDFIIALIVLTILLPLLIICSIWIKFDSPGPVFFFQERAGRFGAPFKIFKLRTMTNKLHNNKTEVFSNNAEVTAIGKYLRKYKIDELPQLINVLLGDLSLIGPRPLLPETVLELDDEENKRMKVRPGLSGLAQVNGNIYISREERFRYDVTYVENLSFLLDVKILLKTVLVIFKGEENFVKK